MHVYDEENSIATRHSRASNFAQLCLFSLFYFLGGEKLTICEFVQLEHILYVFTSKTMMSIGLHSPAFVGAEVFGTRRVVVV